MKKLKSPKFLNIASVFLILWAACVVWIVAAICCLMFGIDLLIGWATISAFLSGGLYFLFFFLFKHAENAEFLDLVFKKPTKEFMDNVVNKGKK